MVVSTKSAALIGLDVHEINIEVDTTVSVPQIIIIGLPDTAINEAKERLRLAIKNSGYSIPQSKVVINLAPADIKKEGSSFDLAMAVGILAKQGAFSGKTTAVDTRKKTAADAKENFETLPDLSRTVFLGELSLDGSLRPVNGVIAIMCDLKKLGIERVILPSQNLKEAGFVPEIEALGADNLSQVIGFLKYSNTSNNAPCAQEPKCSLKKPEQKNIEEILQISSEADAATFDFKDVKGQTLAKRALEIAAAGGHNVLMQGTPGSGKTMLAKAFTSILPPLTPKEAIELTKIYSIAGLLDRNSPLLTKRPFRCPHHSASAVGIIGGGSNPKPGEITLAHRGVLFLDEMVEFPRSTLEVLRQPLEDKVVTISRAQISLQYPANFILIGAMNPCPCGYLGDSEKKCSCSNFEINRYRSRLSGPLLDRIDIRINVKRLKEEELTSGADAEPSKDVRARVVRAREIQLERYKNENILINSELTGKLIKKYCSLSPDAKEFLKSSVSRLSLSARSYDRILKLARTIADLEASRDIAPHHIAQALQMRDF